MCHRYNYNKNVYKKRVHQKNEENEQLILLDPYDIMCEIKDDNNIRVNDWDVPFDKRFVLFDIQLQAKGQDEDRMYSFDSIYRKNIRRGNAIIKEYNSSNEDISTFWGRKGQEKFFDLYCEYIEVNLGERNNLSNFGIKNQEEHFQLKHIIFNGISNAFKQQNQVQIIKTEKANGENAQISYVPQLNAWIIGSKNVTLAARTRSDLELYSDEVKRFNFAKLIAFQWFNILDDILKKENGQQIIDDIRHQLIGKTLVGEYCGNQDYQHLIKYDKIQIRFFSIVNNKSIQSCLSPLESNVFFDKYGLTHVNLSDEGTYSNWKDFNIALKKLYYDISCQDLDSEQEGCVIYFVKKANQNVGNQQDEVLTLAKLKTLEYRIFRKLREKLRNQIQNKQQQHQNFKNKNYLQNKFIEEVKELCTSIKPKKPLDFYFKIAEISFQFIERYPNSAYLVHDHYIDFLSLVIFTIDKQLELKPEMFQKDFLQPILQTPWNQFIQQTDNHNKQQIKGLKPVIILEPIGIPGCGKSTIFDYLKEEIKEQKLDIEIIFISSDDIRKKEQDKLSQQKPNLTPNQSFELSGRPARQSYNQEVINALQQSAKKNDNNIVIIILDKNHIPNAIEQAHKIIDMNTPKNINVIKMCLLPKCQSTFNYKNNLYPFSLNFLFNCIYRVQNRTTHQTLVTQGTQSLSVVTMFIQFFRNADLQEATLKKQFGYQKCIFFPMVCNEQANSDQQYSNEMVNALQVVLDKTFPGSQCLDQQLLQQLLDQIEKCQQIKNQVVNFLEIRNEIKRIVDEIKSYSIQTEVNNNNPNQNQQQSQQNIQDNQQIQQCSKIEEETKDQNNQKQSTQQLAVEKSTKRPAKFPYNPPKTPLFLGIFIKNEEIAKNQISNFIQTNLLKLQEKYPQNKSLKDNLVNFNKLFKFPQSLHVTSYFVAGKINTFYYSNFEEGIPMIINIPAIVFIPFKIICTPCFPDKNLVDIQNKCPHLTMMIGTWKAVQSNIVLNALFINDSAPLKKEYEEQIFQQQSSELITSVKVNIENQDIEVFIIKPNNNLEFQAITKGFFI